MNYLPRNIFICLICLVSITALLAGCTNTAPQGQFEKSGQYHKAYEQYRRQLADNPSNAAAATGMRRTAPHAAAYWQRHAYQAAEQNNWQQATQYHRKVLQIKPNELSSILSLRQIQRHRPIQLASAQPKALIIEQAAPKTAAPVQTPPPKPVVLKKPTPPTPPAKSVVPKEPKPTAAVKPKESKPQPPAMQPVVVLRPTTQPVARRAQLTPKPQSRPALPKPRAQASAAQSQPARSQVASPTPPTPRAPRIDPRKQKPRATFRRNARDAQFIMVIRVSRDDHRYPKIATLQDGLAIKVKDTDGKPLDADMELYLGKKCIAKFKDLPEDTIIAAIGRSTRRYHIVLMDIYDPTETVTVGIKLQE